MAAMGQGQLAQGGLVNAQFRGQPGARGMVSNAGLGAGMANTGMIAAGAGGPQQYSNQRANMPQQMLGAAGNVPRASMAAVTSGVRPGSGGQMPRQMMQPNVPGAAGANVRFNQTARNVTAPQQQPRTSVPMRAGVSDQAHTVLANMSEREQKQLLGEQIFRKVEKINGELAGKITGMLIGMDTTELMKMIESEDFLREKVQEGIAVLEKRGGVNASAANSAASAAPDGAATAQTGDSAASGQAEGAKAAERS